MKISFYALLLFFSAFSMADTLHNCVKIGDRINCSSLTREEANTPPTSHRLGSKAYCLVSKIPLQKYFCNYDSYDKCMITANVDNLGGNKTSSCIPNSTFQGSQTQFHEKPTNRERIDTSEGDMTALLTAYQEGDYETAAKLALSTPQNPIAQFLLAAMYDEGKGLPKDKKQALKWLERAAKGGLKEAQEALEEYRSRLSNNKKNRDLYTLPPSTYIKEVQYENETCIYHSQCADGLVCNLGICQPAPRK